MTSSPVDSIAKAMEGVNTPMSDHIERARAYMARGARMTLDAIPNDGSMSRYGFGPDVTLAISELLSVARQAEAMKREMAEKDARIAALEDALKPFAAHRTADGINGPGSLLHIPDEHPLLFNGLGNDVRVTVTVGDVRRARALIGGSNANE